MNSLVRHINHASDSEHPEKLHFKRQPTPQPEPQRTLHSGATAQRHVIGRLNHRTISLRLGERHSKLQRREI